MFTGRADDRAEDIGRSAALACLWAACARSPGLADRFHDGRHLTFIDLATSAAAIAPVMAQAPDRSIGDTIYEAVAVTRRLVGKNTNLGIVLLLAPPASARSVDELPAVLAATTVADARRTYAAIRLAEPGGLGRADVEDVASEPTRTLTEVMRLAAERDSIARQYATDFADVMRIAAGFAGVNDLGSAITEAYWRLLAELPDSHVARKHGPDTAEEVRRRSGETTDRPATDRWLREQGIAPGATADLVTAALFVALRAGTIPLPPPWPPMCTAS